jgi:hypothetical protein
MFTGTLINDLMATVERAEQNVRQIADERELHEIFSMQIPVTEGGQIFARQAFMGAA